METQLIDHLHPAITVFPAALFPLAFLLEVIQIVRPSTEKRRCIQLLVTVACVAVILAFLSGYLASERANGTFEVPDAAISAHHTVGRLLLFVSIPLTALLWIACRATHAVRIFEWLFRVLLLAAVVLTTMSGYLGGELVKRHGAGVRVEH